ncbi:MAG TPA: hypothetical protein VHB02_03855 [Acidimicrobiales bacterium]|nr:hypothetical protein [Acidimicrobiales bacterium]
MSSLPDRLRQGTEVVPNRRALALLRQGELEVFGHSVRSAVVAAKESIDNQAAADAARASLDEELHTYDFGMRRAGSDPAKQALVVDAVLNLNRRNNRRLDRRYG